MGEGRARETHLVAGALIPLWAVGRICQLVEMMPAFSRNLVAWLSPALFKRGGRVIKIEYQEIRIPKKKGGYRTVYIPSAELKKIQRKILRWLKKIALPKDPFLFFSLNGLFWGSFIEHAKIHSNSRWIFKIDIKDAFASVKEPDIEKIFLDLLSQIIPSKYQQLIEKELDFLMKATTFKGKLPEGAPTSPFLFGLVLVRKRILTKIHNICNPNWMVSCYVDNIVISGNKKIPSEIRKKIIEIIEEAGFQINKEKTRLFDCRQGAVMITGLRVDGTGRIFLPKKKVRKWRGMIHRAVFEKNEDLIKKVEGFRAFLKPLILNGYVPPKQIEKPLALFMKAHYN